MSTVKKINDRKREQKKLRALALETGMNRAARRAERFAALKKPAETPVTDELKAKAKTKKVKAKDAPTA
jgi:hypothetical protein